MWTIAWAFIRPFLPQILIGLVLLIGVTSWNVHERHIQKAKDAKVITALKADVAGYQKSMADIARIQGEVQAAQKAAAKQAATALANARKAAQAHDRALQNELARYRKAKPVSCADEPLPEGVL